MKILNFGSCNIDFVYSVEHIVRKGETITTNKLETFPGGKGLNQSIAIARSGFKVYHAGCIGEDGEMLKNVLIESGVDISHLKKVDGKNGHAVIQVNKEGANSIFLYPGSNEMLDEDFICNVLSNFEKGDILLLQNEINNLDYIVKKAYEKEMCIILNPSPYNEKLNEIDFNMLSYIILNEVEAEEISHCTMPEECMAYLKNTYPYLKVILTLGENGCIYMDETNFIRQSAYKVTAVDTTAAGDTFTGYFVSGIAKGEKIKDILKLSSCASAIAVSKNGAAPSIPKKDEVLKTVGTLKPYDAKNKTEILISKIETYTKSNLKTITLKNLSDYLGYSTVYTGTLIKKLTGLSFSKYVQSKRCLYAAKMLSDTDMSIESIIESIGYENESFFRKIFKEKYGKNPLAFRKMGGK